MDFRLDKSTFSVGRMEDDDDPAAYWATRTPQQRIAALEWLRRTTYGRDRINAPMEPVLEVVHEPRDEAHRSP